MGGDMKAVPLSVAILVALPVVACALQQDDVSSTESAVVSRHVLVVGASVDGGAPDAPADPDLSEESPADPETPSEGDDDPEEPSVSERATGGGAYARWIASGT
jgi:hypothetical protein